MTTTGANGNQQESRLSLDDPNETPGTEPDVRGDRYRGLTLTSGGDGDDLDDDDDDDDDDEEDDDDADAGDGESESSPA